MKYILSYIIIIYIYTYVWDVIRREVCRVGFDQRNPKPETWNPKPTVKVGFELRNPKPETDSEDLTSPGPTETRNPKTETRNRLWRPTVMAIYQL